MFYVANGTHIQSHSVDIELKSRSVDPVGEVRRERIEKEKRERKAKTNDE